MSLVTSLRRLRGGCDVTKAIVRERELVEDELARRDALTQRLIQAFSAGGPDAVELGAMVGTNHPVRLPVKMLLGHTGVWGPSGSGKSYLTVLMLTSLLRSGLRRLVVLDPKGETVGLLKRSILDLASSLPEHEAQGLLQRVITIEPFVGESLPRLQVLAGEPGSDPELQAFSVARLVTHESDLGGVGVRQEALLHRLLECLIRSNLPLTVLPAVLMDPGLLDRLAEASPSGDLLRTTAARLRAESRERIGGVQSRVERLLRLSSTRLALGGAPDCLNFGQLLDSIVLVNLEPTEGSVDIGRFIAGVLWIKLTQAVRRRSNGAPPAVVVLEEAPAFLASGTSQGADMTEDLLRLARSKGVFLYLLSQDLASIGKISSTLPTVIKTNVMLHAIFRSQDDDAWGFALPVTGRRPKDPPAPWEERRGGGYLERGAELAQLKQELARLPDRVCYVLDRRTGLPAVLMRTANLALRASATEVSALDERASQSGGAVLPVATLKQGLAEVEARLSALRGHAVERTTATKDTVPAPRRRRVQPLEMG